MTLSGDTNVELYTPPPLPPSLALGRHQAAQYLLAVEPGQIIDTEA